MLDAATHTEKKSTEQTNTPNKETLTSTKTLFIHWQYHQYDVDRTVLRRLYDETLKGFDGFDAITVFYSQPKNLRDILTNTVLEQPPDEKMSEIIEYVKNTNPREKNESLVPRTLQRPTLPCNKNNNEKQRGAQV
jgi:hypothetical protein